MWETIFWMVVGGVITFAATHLYHNANFKKALDEELRKAKSGVADARANLKAKL